MKRSTLLLKIAVILMAVPVLALTVLLWVEIGPTAIGAVLDRLTLGYIISGILIGITLTIIPFYAALVQAYKLITYIGQEKAFSHLSVKTLRKIKQSAFTISIIYTLLLPLVYIVAEWDDAPGLIIVGAMPVFAAFVMGVFSTVLEHLLEEAIIFKSENELTI